MVICSSSSILFIFCNTQLMRRISWITQYRNTMPIFSKWSSSARLDGKTAVITGCNTGIGKETALDFVKRGARVVMACRDMDKAEEAAEDIRKQTQGCSGSGEVVVVKLNLSSLKSVRECAEHLLKTEKQINLLINNAGIMACPKSLTEDGFETQFGVNHLAHFLLTCLLLPRIKSSAPSRIVNVSSIAHRIGTIHFDDLNSEKSYSPNGAYGQSKLANILFTKELAKRLQGTGVTVYSLHPGVIRTQLYKHYDTAFFPGFRRLFSSFGYIFMKNPTEGAQTTIYCAVDESIANESGLYYKDCKKAQPTSKARDAAVAERLWNESIKLVGLQNWDPFTAEDSPVNAQ